MEIMPVLNTIQISSYSFAFWKSFSRTKIIYIFFFVHMKSKPIRLKKEQISVNPSYKIEGDYRFLLPF